ncbi:MAG: hypothetical protein ACPGJS_07140 [Flammeovirgaceae bacterium]
MKKLYLGIFAIACLMLFNTTNVTANSKKAWMEDDLIAQIIKSIPSPIEITVLMKESGVLYNKELLNDHSKSGKYATNFDKALNLGIYSTDLGFSNIYGKTQDAIHYLDAVQDLAEGLSIEEFFEYRALKDMASSDNLDELIQTTTRNFEKINDHLHEQKRDVISALMLSGGWVESTYLTTLVYKRANNTKVRKALAEKIGEQKLVLERLMLLLDIYSSKPRVPELAASMQELQDVYDEIEIVSGQGGVEIVEHPDGRVEFIDKGEGHVEISEEQIGEITKIIDKIRSNIIQ